MLSRLFGAILAFIAIGGGGGGGGTGAPLNSVINCPSGFSTAGACSVGFFSSGHRFEVNGALNGGSASLSGTQVMMVSAGTVHAGMNMNFQTPVNVTWFTTTFTFVPNGSNISLVFNNSTNQTGGWNGANFSGGAGCEAAFFQGFNPPDPLPPDKTFALEFDSYSPLTNAGSFTYSSAMYYVSNPYIQCPCLDVSQCGNNNTPTPVTKISTSPVPLDSPATSQGTTTGHTYSATVAYDGSTLTLNMYDVTAGGSCPGGTCFTQSWSGVNIATSVGASTAYVGFGGATGTASPGPLYVNTMVYSTH